MGKLNKRLGKVEPNDKRLSRLQELIDVIVLDDFVD